MTFLIIYLFSVIIGLSFLLIADYLTDEKPPSKEDFMLVTLCTFIPLINLLIIGGASLEIAKIICSRQKEKFAAEIIEKINSSKRRKS